MAEVKPTRMELIKLRRRIKLSKRGHALLKMKRDGLIVEFRDMLEQAKEVISRLVDRYEKAEEKLALAMAVEGVVAIKSMALSCSKEPQFSIKKKNIMGVVVPVVKREKVRKPIHEREYGVIGTTARIDEVVSAYEEVVDAVLEVAEIETTLKRLLEEIDKTKRRVNALEYRVIPEMENAARYISFRLEEMDRENIVRLKKIKAKMAAKA
ncbi:H(+)-transporting ATP synthase, vacuolar type, subunit D [Archaeoglobus sulfaticallidus PM70-1]|uniref:A-type ATP synthase subunit D n=1 Tax=Archaeoglobus sulfaticallidus PM70-1 TaxID=387631 RepID=N0BES8_9EURY|nr:V-type ATP synthase subunit D [Archaeoglobus sulfaticallidus]AGK62144.1 H(+)-transporting ATP synthase, vacuolar type, subunit D [Archaeoglobus sulfaticallidus PM70-1]